MGYRRGFKSEANGYAREMRQDLDLEPHEPLCPWLLAEHLGYSVSELSDYAADNPEAVTYLMSESGRDEFSAITLCDGRAPLIIHNDAHHIRRRRANISHELAHGLLIHKPSPLIGLDGARVFNREQEDEANWLGPALLVSEEAALHIAEAGMSVPAACKLYGVSPELMQMRLGVTGALIRIGRRSRAAAINPAQ